jgi:hypothetical protein
MYWPGFTSASERVTSVVPTSAVSSSSHADRRRFQMWMRWDVPPVA